MGLDVYHWRPVHKSHNKKYLDYLSLDDLSGSPDFIARHAKYIVDKDFGENGIEKVIYVDTKGYQRKGMKADFYIDFRNDGIYFDLQSLVKAYSYLKADHISTLTELQRNFQENIIDNFIEGESISCVRW